VLAYNGEIYNFTQIEQRLRAAGVAVRGASDAEILLHAWSRWGAAILSDLQGFWAFVVYDKVRHRLTLVRDQFGVKPLYYRHTKDGVCVSSLLGTIMSVTPEGAELDYEALSEYVRYQFTFGDKTFVRQVRKVAPGHLVEIDLDRGDVRTSCYEDIFGPRPGRAVPISPDGSRRPGSHRLRSGLDYQRRHSTFQHGGLDSSLMRIVRPEIAYHCNCSGSGCNETFYAQR
jgi:asparagine synthetase B (glutamine-hydrolysing)